MISDVLQLFHCFSKEVSVFIALTYFFFSPGSSTSRGEQISLCEKSSLWDHSRRNVWHFWQIWGHQTNQIVSLSLSIFVCTSFPSSGGVPQIRREQLMWYMRTFLMPKMPVNICQDLMCATDTLWYSTINHTRWDHTTPVLVVIIN